jgi:YidC/Oxa1 family membrane protein insertase
LPMLVQMPIFLGLFYMLRSASELRYESFLWVTDLSQPDTLTHVAGFPLNLLPLLMGLTMFIQMSMMPVSPTADPAQQKIFKFLPFVFLVFLYNVSSGLVLYWTVQNLLTIVQQKVINSRPDEELKPVAAAQAATAARGGSPRTKARRKK